MQVYRMSTGTQGTYSMSLHNVAGYMEGPPHPGGRNGPRKCEIRLAVQCVVERGLSTHGRG